MTNRKSHTGMRFRLRSYQSTKVPDKEPGK